MAKGVFTFRITSEGVEELKRQLEQLGPAGQKAFDQLRQMSPQLKDAFEQAGRSVDQARQRVEQMPRGMNALADSFDRAEGAVKKGGRVLNDAVGTITLLGGLAGPAGTQMGALASTVGNVADVFGTLATVLGKHPLLSMAGVAALAVTGFVALQAKTEEVTAKTLTFADAIKRVREEAEKLTGKTLEAQGGSIGEIDRLLAQRSQDLSKAQREYESKVAAFRAVEARRDQSFSVGGAGGPQLRSAAGTTRAEREIAKAKEEYDKLNTELQRLYTRRDELRRAEAENVNEFAGRGEALAAIGVERKKKAAEDAKTAAEKANREYDELEKRIAANIEATVTASMKRNESVERYIEKLENEGKLSAQTNEEREVGRALYEAQAKLVDELGNKVRDLTDAERARITQAVKAKEAFEQQAKAAEKMKQEMERAAARSTDRLVDFAGDALFDRLMGKSQNFWESFRQWGMRAISQLAAEMVFRPIIAPIMQSVVSAAPALFGVSGVNPATQTVSGGGLGSMFSSPVSSLFSTGGSLISSALGGSGGLLQTIGGAIGGALGLGGGSAALGAFSSAAFASTAAATGTAAAATAGSSLAAGGVLGAAAGAPGAIAGTAGAAALSPLAATGIGALIAIPAMLALGGLFGRKKSVGPFASYAVGLQPDGTMTFRGGGEKNGGSMAQMREATEAFAQGIKQVADALGIFKLPGMNIGVGSNVARGTFYGTAGDESGAVYFGDDPGVAAATYIRRALQGTLKDSSLAGGRLDASTEAARLFARTTGDAKTDLEFVAVYEGLDKTAAASREVSRALDQLNAQFDTYADLARQYGLEVERIEKGRAEAIDNVVAQLMAPITDRFASTRSLLASLSMGAGSPLSADAQLANARRQFEDYSSKASAGDAAAQSVLGEAGRSYLDLARGFYGTTESYASVYSDVVGRLGDIIQSVRDTDPTVRAIVEQGEKGTAAVTKVIGVLIEEVQRLREEVRRGNEIPMRVLA